MDGRTTPVPAEYIAAYEKLGFGLFVHWGLYSLLGQGEWTMHSHRIPKQEYEQLAKRFTAERFDGRALAQLAKRAGMRYIVLTTRHHDGFSLYDTKGLNTYDAPHSAAKRDLVAEFVEGCRHEGIVPFFYHTTLDWHNELFASDFDAYLEYLNRSVEVLCTQYGKIGGIWFDGNWSKPDADWKLDALYGAIRRRQPEAVIVNNTGLDARGRVGHPEIDGVTFEQGRPTPLDRRGHAKYVAAEMCQTMNGHWGFGRHDFCYQSV
ncbi:MAG: alpha-L-fucosidase, partial [Oscillospiraceae bacterium]